MTADGEGQATLARFLSGRELDLGPEDLAEFLTVIVLFHPEIEWDTSRLNLAVLGLDPVYRGLEGVARFWTDWASSWDRIHFRYGEATVVGDHVVFPLTQRSRGRGSGAETEFGPYGQAYTFDGDLIVRMRFYPTPEAAIADLG